MEGGSRGRGGGGRGALMDTDVARGQGIPGFQVRGGGSIERPKSGGGGLGKGLN